MDKETAIKLLELHNAVINAMRDVWRDVQDDQEMLRRMERVGAAQREFETALGLRS